MCLCFVFREIDDQSSRSTSASTDKSSSRNTCGTSNDWCEEQQDRSLEKEMLKNLIVPNFYLPEQFDAMDDWKPQRIQLFKDWLITNEKVINKVDAFIYETIAILIDDFEIENPVKE